MLRDHGGRGCFMEPSTDGGRPEHRRAGEGPNESPPFAHNEPPGGGIGRSKRVFARSPTGTVQGARWIRHPSERSYTGSRADANSFGTASCRTPYRHGPSQVSSGADLRLGASAVEWTLRAAQTHGCHARLPRLPARSAEFRFRPPPDDAWYRACPGRWDSVPYGYPLALPLCWRCRGMPGSSRSGQRRAGGSRGHDEASPISRLSANHGACASRSFHSHSQVPAGASAMGFRSATRRESHRASIDQGRGVCRPSASAAQVEEEVRSPPTAGRAQAVQP